MAILNLTFHGLGEPTRTLDSGESDVWVPVRVFSNALDLLETRRKARLTFDDGNESDVRVALPELVRRNLKAIFFVVAGRIGQPGFLGVKELRELIGAGMEIGCHGMNHRSWRGLEYKELAEEIISSKCAIEQCLSQSITLAACPFGSYGRRVLRSLQRAGYGRVYTSDRGWTNESAWLQPRNTLHNGDSVDDVRRLLDGETGPCGLTHAIKLMVKRCR